MEPLGGRWGVPREASARPLPAFCARGGQRPPRPGPHVAAQLLSEATCPPGRGVHAAGLLSQGLPSPAHSAHWARGAGTGHRAPRVRGWNTHVLTCPPPSLQVAAPGGTWTRSTTVSLVPLRALSLPPAPPLGLPPVLGCDPTFPRYQRGAAANLGCRKGACNPPIASLLQTMRPSAKGA